MNMVCEAAESDVLLVGLVSGSLIVPGNFLTFVITSFLLLVAKVPEVGANRGEKKTTEAKEKVDGSIR